MRHKQDHQKLCVNSLGTLDNGPSVAEDKLVFPTSFLHGIPCPWARGRQAMGQLRPGSTVSIPQVLGHQGKLSNLFQRTLSLSSLLRIQPRIGRHICVGFPRTNVSDLGTLFRVSHVMQYFYPCKEHRREAAAFATGKG